MCNRDASVRKIFFSHSSQHIFSLSMCQGIVELVLFRDCLLTHKYVEKSNLLSRHFCDGPFTVPFHPENTEMCVIHQNFPELKRLDSPVICKIRHLLVVGTHSRVDSFVRFFWLWCAYMVANIHSSMVTFMDLPRWLNSIFSQKKSYYTCWLWCNGGSSIVGLVFLDSMHRLTGPVW